MPSRLNRRRLVHKQPPKLDSVRNDINVTPLVDVCLVLLIIFMVILPMLERGKDVKLPLTKHHVDQQDNNEPIVVVDEHGKVYVDKTEVKDLAEMKTEVQGEWTALEAQNQRVNSKDRSGENRVLLKAHPTAKYGMVYPVVMALHDLGAAGIDLGTNENKEGKE